MKGISRVNIHEAVKLLQEGQVVALPTETVYGLGANGSDPLAIAKIFQIKRRPTNHPLILHVASLAHVAGWAFLDERAEKLASHFWPGPMTLILKKGPLTPKEVTGGRDCVGIRVPSHPLMRELLGRFGGAIAAPSANRFGKVSPTTAEHVEKDLQGEDIYLLDGGPSEVGIESTIVDLSSEKPAILRLGAIVPEEIEAVLGEGLEKILKPSEAKASGQLKSHYAPNATLLVLPENEIPAFLKQEPLAIAIPYLGESPALWAQKLYQAIRQADEQRPSHILVPSPPSGPMQDAVLDRLSRAATKP